jgi:hypothetical protein
VSLKSKDTHIITTITLTLHQQLVFSTCQVNGRSNYLILTKIQRVHSKSGGSVVAFRQFACTCFACLQTQAAASSCSYDNNKKMVSLF